MAESHNMLPKGNITRAQASKTEVLMRDIIEQKSMNNKRLTREEILYLVTNLKNLEIREWIYKTADSVRKKYMTDTVFLRGIIEFSNICSKSCLYCGINSRIKNVERYRMEKEEILETCFQIKKNGQTTVVLQSGEDPYYTKEKMGEIIKAIKEQTELAVTLSVGERDEETFLYWKNCGMDRYLLRFETSNREIFKKLHPDGDFDNRINCLKVLKKIGVQTGSGFMIGLPGADDNDLVNDINQCRELDLDMIGVGPFIAHPETELKEEFIKHEIDYITGVIAILRLTNPDSHIPATTAFDAVLEYQGRQLALKRGANIFMPNSTPQKYRKSYQLYPGKPCVDESGDDCASCVVGRITSIGRTIGKGPGHSMKRG
jgi:biotin synthase